MRTYLTHYLSCFSKRIARGFTLVELLVVVAVITLLSTGLLFSQRGFNSATLLRGLAYSTALTIRQAQAFGTAVRGTLQSGQVSFATGYGVHVSAGDLQRLYMFADLDGDGVKDTTPDETAGLPPLVFGQGFSITRFCGVITDAIQDCYPSGVGGGATLGSAGSMVLYFRRPNPDACISTNVNPSACSVGGTPVYTGAYLEVSSAGSPQPRAVRITNTGQIVVCQIGDNPVTC